MQSLFQAHPTPDTANAVDIEYMREVFAWAAARVRNEFQPTTWQAFTRTFVGGQSVARVSLELGLSVGAIYVARSRVMKRLRDEISKYANPEWMSSDLPREEDLS
ncbi:MAG: DNA-directed RNA polymerase specialized sigma24 family protein [Pirellulaceae bacterium]|jgi:DNA-directed RNA polymerase specialized sigma24 family protein